jgi:hypothetical protein
MPSMMLVAVPCSGKALLAQAVADDRTGPAQRRPSCDGSCSCPLTSLSLFTPDTLVLSVSPLAHDLLVDVLYARWWWWWHRWYRALRRALRHATPPLAVIGCCLCCNTLTRPMRRALVIHGVTAGLGGHVKRCIPCYVEGTATWMTPSYALMDVPHSTSAA